MRRRIAMAAVARRRSRTPSAPAGSRRRTPEFARAEDAAFAKFASFHISSPLCRVATSHTGPDRRIRGRRSKMSRNGSQRASTHWSVSPNRNVTIGVSTRAGYSPLGKVEHSQDNLEHLAHGECGQKFNAPRGESRRARRHRSRSFGRTRRTRLLRRVRVFRDPRER